MHPIRIFLTAVLLISTLAQAQTWQSVSGSGGAGYSHPDCFIGMNTADIPTKCAVGKPVWNSQGRFTPVGVYAGFGAGKHLITTPQDSKAFDWGCYGTTTGATSTTNGEENTNIIINTSCPSYPNKAAQVCRDLGRQWYLPAREELQVLYNNRSSIGGFSTESYWSSTEDDSYYAWLLFFSNGVWYYFGTKTSPNLVRCVRGF